MKNYQTLTEKPRETYTKKEPEEEISKTFIERTSSKQSKLWQHIKYYLVYIFPDDLVARTGNA